METQKRLKIAFIHPDLGIGGAERLVLDIASALARQKHEILFITNHFDRNHAFEELKNGEYPVQVIGDWLPRSFFGRFQALCAYIRMIYLSLVYVIFMRSSYKPDLYFTDLIPAANLILNLAGEKVIYYCHHPDLLASSPGGRFKKLYRLPIDWVECKTTAKADTILVNSAYTASVFKKTFPTIEKPIQILYPTIAFSYQETLKKIKKPKHINTLIPQIKSERNDLVIFLSVNRFHPAKNLGLAIYALEKLRRMTSTDEWDRTYFIMAGGYDPQSHFNHITFNQLEKITKECQLEDKIIFLKSPADIFKAELLLACTCLIYTPVKEHFGIVPLEAMLAGKPVIACNSGGPRETINHGITGYLCEPNPDSMAEFMCRVFSEDVKSMGNEGKKRLEENFSYESFGGCLKKVLNRTFNETTVKKKK